MALWEIFKKKIIMHKEEYTFMKQCTSFHIDKIFLDIKNRIYLIADIYSAEYARALNIQIIQIPRGTTDLFQPLDKKVSGVLKVKALFFINDIMKLYDSEVVEFKDEIPPPRAITKKDATAILEKCWESLKKETIISAWHDALLKHIESPDFDEEEVSEVLSDESF